MTRNPSGPGGGAAGPDGRPVVELGRPVVELYGRAGCCLCDDARVTLEGLRDELGFRLVELDITADDAVHRAYFERIPVICLDGEELCDFHLDEDVLRAALTALGDDLKSPR